MKKNNFPRKYWCILWLLIGFLSVGLSLTMGEIESSYADVVSVIMQGDTETISTVAIEYIRMPHGYVAFVVGMILGVSGLVMQSILQNDLADPYLLGISTGGSLGAVICILLGSTLQIPPQFSTALGAFTGSIVVAFVILSLAYRLHRSQSMGLILIGIGINALVSGVINLTILWVADTSKTKAIQFWLLGSMGESNMMMGHVLCVIACVVGIFFMLQHRVLDMMLFGDEAAISMGYNLQRYRVAYILIISVLIGITIYCVGIIGFVGFIAPNIARLLIGNAHRYVIPLSMIIGGTFLAWADVLSRNLVSGMELPIGIATMICGSPILLIILLRRNGR